MSLPQRDPQSCAGKQYEPSRSFLQAPKETLPQVCGRLYCDGVRGPSCLLRAIELCIRLLRTGRRGSGMGGGGAWLQSKGQKRLKQIRELVKLLNFFPTQSLFFPASFRRGGWSRTKLGWAGLVSLLPRVTEQLCVMFGATRTIAAASVFLSLAFRGVCGIRDSFSGLSHQQ